MSLVSLVRLVRLVRTVRLVRLVVRCCQQALALLQLVMQMARQMALKPLQMALSLSVLRLQLQLIQWPGASLLSQVQQQAVKTALLLVPAQSPRVSTLWPLA